MRDTRRRIGIARVHGRSMLPTLREGDRLLIGYGAAVRPGRIVVVRLPDGTLAIKRATALLDDGWWVERDNPSEGVDSARVGCIPLDRVYGVALGRLWPRPRIRL